MLSLVMFFTNAFAAAPPCNLADMSEESAYESGTLKQKTHFLKTEGACPSDQAKCRTKKYVLAGDKVIVGTRQDRWSCAFFVPKRGRATSGFLPTASFTTLPIETNPKPEAWLGDWVSGEESLTIKAKAGNTETLAVSGVASWEGSMPGQVNVGEVKAESTPSANKMKLKEDECEISLTLVENVLLATDNLKCGGLNVSFAGTYTRGK